MADVADTTVAPAGQAAVPTVFTRAGEVFASSRDVAAHFGKGHNDVLRRIRALVAQEASLGLRTFAQWSYALPETGSQQHVCFDMTRDGFALLAMGFTGEKALRFKLAWIEAFNRMEAELRAAPPKTVAVRPHRRAAPHRADPVLLPPAHDNQAVMRIAGETVLVDLARCEVGPEERAVCVDSHGEITVETVKMTDDPHNRRRGTARVPRRIGRDLVQPMVYVVGAVIGTLSSKLEADGTKPKQIAAGPSRPRRFEPGSHVKKDLLLLVRSARQRITKNRTLDLGQVLAETLEDLIAREDDPAAPVRGAILDWNQDRATADMHRTMRAKGKHPAGQVAREVLH